VLDETETLSSSGTISFVVLDNFLSDISLWLWWIMWDWYVSFFYMNQMMNGLWRVMGNSRFTKVPLSIF
jgi:hypothetical protein